MTNRPKKRGSVATPERTILSHSDRNCSGRGRLATTFKVGFGRSTVKDVGPGGNGAGEGDPLATLSARVWLSIDRAVGFHWPCHCSPCIRGGPQLLQHPNKMDKHIPIQETTNIIAL